MFLLHYFWPFALLYAPTFVVAIEYLCKHFNGCYCYKVNENYQYVCSNITLRYFIDQAVDIECADLDWNNSILPNLGVENLEAFTLNHCPLPSNFESFLKRLGIHSIKALTVTLLSLNTTLSSTTFNGIRNLKQITFRKSNLEYIAQDAFANLDALTEINLLSSNLKRIKPKAFNKLKQLRILKLTSNNLSDLPDKAFEDLSKLVILDLSANKLQQLDRRIFKNLKNLVSLELSTNSLKDLPEDLFTGLSSLKSLNLFRNNLKHIPQDLFKNLNLEIITLSHNSIAGLPNYLFANLTRLSEVYLDSCNLTFVPDNLFDGSVNLKSISLAFNEIEEISSGLFKGLRNLNVLDLKFNRIRKLHNDAFASLYRLEYLNMGNNLLAELGYRSFDSFFKIQRMYFNNNRLVTFQNRLFRDTRSLREIYFSDNYLDFPKNELYLEECKCMGRFLPTNTNLEIIDLKNNSISSLSIDYVGGKPQLKSLDLSFNNISRLCAAILVQSSGVSKIINVTNNNIANIELRNDQILNNFGKGAFLDKFGSVPIHLQIQSTILLNSNSLDCDCNLYNFTQYLDQTINPELHQVLKIKANNLKCGAPADKIGFSVLEFTSKNLTCSLNKLEVYRKFAEKSNSTIISICPKECRCELRIWDRSLLINCSNRNLTVVPSIVTNIELSHSKIEVDLQNNLLIAGPGKGMGYENVTTLILSQNQISSLTWIPQTLTVLKVDGNNIKGLDKNFLSNLNFSSISNVTFGNNPWTCDCSTAVFLKYLVSHLSTVQIDVNNIRCTNTGDILASVNLQEICLTTKHNSHTLIFLSCVLIFIFCGFLIYHRRVREEDIEDKPYDAFISYSHKDEDFVLNELQSVLEAGPNPYTLCIHIRDWVPGEAITKQIIRSVDQSHRTIVILSQNFVDSVWTTMEFRTAHTQAIAERKARVIVILYGDIDFTCLDNELKVYVQTNTFLKWNDPWFWKKLRSALPYRC